MVNYASKYSKQIDQIYTHESFVAGIATGKFEFTGVKTLKVFAPQTVPVTDYDADEGYGTPKRMGNEVQEMMVSQDKKFSLIIDKGDATSTNGTMEAGARLRQQLNEQVVPTQDKYALAEYVKQAGTVAGVAAPTTEKAVYKLLLAARAALNNALVPMDGRYCFMGSSYVGNLLEAGMIVANPQVAGKNYTKGDVGRVLGFKIVEVPDTYLPDGAYFVCVRGDAIVNPHKVHDATSTKSELYNGERLNGRFLYDAFVLGKKSGAVYAAVASASKQATPTIAISGTTATVTSTGATAIKVTTDGTDPRYSESAVKVQSGGTVTVKSGDVVKAVAYGTFTSDIATKNA
jgi:hypothetical protein